MVRNQIIDLLKKAAGDDAMADILVPEIEALGHYSTNVAMRLAKAQGKKPMDLAGEITEKLRASAPAGTFEKIKTAAPGFINFWLSKETIQKEFEAIVGDRSFGLNETMKGKMVMVEYTDPNPFKLFHIGHLMTNTIGESFARLYEATGAKVRRANYYGDVGLHIAKSVWGMKQLASETPRENESPVKKVDFLGKAYACGSRAYEEKAEAKEEIVAINKKIYERSDEAINKLYDAGLAWSLAYFETVYKRLGTKFDDYFPESTIGDEGLALVRSRTDIFKESDGAVIFPGEQYGLHTRVFVNSQGLPTYEAKELGLNKKKFEMYPLNLSIIVTANEINEYFKVLLKAMELVLPEVAAKTRHASHGMLRLPSGKMSSRTGNITTADSLLGDIKAKLTEHVSEKSDLDASEREAVTEIIAVGAIKYSILKQAPGQDIVFDFEKSLSVHGDSGPYLQYTYARLKSILRKSKVSTEGGSASGGENPKSKASPESLDSETELALMRKLFDFPDIVANAGKRLAPNLLATYLHQLAMVANHFYESTPILKDENTERMNARLSLVETVARILKSGLNLLGIRSPEKI